MTEVKLEYEEVDGVMLPKIDLSDFQIDIGIYGDLRFKFLASKCPVTYQAMVATGRMGAMMKEFNDRAKARLEELEEQLIARDKAAGVIPSKNDPNLAWVKWRNGIHDTAEETVIKEMVEARPVSAFAKNKDPETYTKQ